MGLKKCKECGEEISSSAKTCPKCGKDQRNFFQKHIVLTVILVLLLIGIVGGSKEENKTSSSSVVSVSSSQPNSVEEKIYNIGDSISTSKYEITIEHVGTATQVGSKYFESQPAEGGIYVTVDSKLKNISSEPLSSWSFPTIKLVDENGVSYSKDISASSYYATEKDPNRKVLSDLNPGISVTDNDVFEISKEAYDIGNWFIIIDNNIKVKIK